MQRRYLFIIGIIIFLCSDSLAQGSPRETDVIVNASIEKGPMPRLLGTNIIWSDSSNLRKEYLDSFRGGMVRVWIYNWTVKPDGSGYNFDDELVRMIKNAGCEPVVSIIQVPRWLSTNKNEKGMNAQQIAYATLAAPTDYEKWAEIIYRIVHHYNVAQKLNVKYFAIWNEPGEGYWRSSAEELFKLYKISVEAALRADPNVKVGGLSFYAWDSMVPETRGGTRRRDLTETWMHQFIKYASDNKLPLDFISWHEYYSEPALDDKTSVPTIRSWLEQFGYNKTALFITEWNSERRDDHTNAAYAIASLCNMVRDGIDGQMFFTLGDDPRRGDSLSNDFGMMTSRAVKKPVFHAFKMFSSMKGRIVESKSARKNIYTLSSKTEDSLYVLICNYSASLRRQLIQRLRKKGYKKGLLRSYGLSKQDVRDIIKKKKGVDDLAIPDKLKSDIREIMKSLREEMAKKDAPIRLYIKNIPFNAKFQYRKYLIDDKARFDIVESNMVQPTQDLAESLDLAPYSAVLIVLKR